MKRKKKEVSSKQEHESIFWKYDTLRKKYDIRNVDQSKLNSFQKTQLRQIQEFPIDKLKKLNQYLFVDEDSND